MTAREAALIAWSAFLCVSASFLRSACVGVRVRVRVGVRVRVRIRVRIRIQFFSFCFGVGAGLVGRPA